MKKLLGRLFRKFTYPPTGARVGHLIEFPFESKIQDIRGGCKQRREKSILGQFLNRKRKSTN